MPNSKEYLKIFEEKIKTKDINIALVEIFNSMFLEVKSIAKTRNATRNNAIISIFNEMNTKANSFVSKVNKLHLSDENGMLLLKRDSFKLYVKQKSPEFAEMLDW